MVCVFVYYIQKLKCCRSYVVVYGCFYVNRYIVWMSENFFKGGKDLGSLFEWCMIMFKDEERYKNDE